MLLNAKNHSIYMLKANFCLIFFIYQSVDLVHWNFALNIHLYLCLNVFVANVASF